MLKKHEGDLSKAKYSISIKEDGDSLKLVFKDNGVGVPQEKIDQVFEPFYTSKKASEGKGLGMTLVKSIVDKNKGTIDIRSEENESFEVGINIKKAA